MNKRCCNCFSSSKIKSAKTNTPKITNMTETRFEMADMWSDIDRVESKMTPRLRAVEVGVIETFEGIARIGLDSLDKSTYSQGRSDGGGFRGSNPPLSSRGWAARTMVRRVRVKSRQL